jgi:hypothetical protein
MYDPGTLYVDPILTNFSVGYKDQRLFALDIFPETPVNSPSGRYRVFDRSDWIIHRSRREPGTQARTVGHRKWSEDVFKTQEHSLQSEIYDEERQELVSQGGLANPVFGGALQIDPEQDATKYCTRSILLELELMVANTMRDTTQYPTNHTSTLTTGGTGTQWSNYALATAGDPLTAYSNPVNDLRVAFQRIHLDTGEWPNLVVIPFDAVGIIENHPRLVQRFQYWALWQPEAWQTLMGLPAEATSDLRIIVVDSKYNSADNLDQPESIQTFWGQDVFVGKVDPTPGQDTFTFAKTFAQIYPNGTTRPTDNWREENRKTDIIRVSYKYDVKVVSGLAGFLFKNAVTAVSTQIA